MWTNGCWALDKATGGGKLFTYLGIFRLLLSLMSTVGGFTAPCRYIWANSCVACMLRGGVLLWLLSRCRTCTAHAPHFPLPPPNYNFAEDQTEKENSTLDCLCPQWHPRARDHNVARFYLVKNQPAYKQTLCSSHFMAGRHRLAVLLRAAEANKSHLEQRPESSVIRSLSGAARRTVTNQSIQCLQHM